DRLLHHPPGHDPTRTTTPDPRRANSNVSAHCRTMEWEVLRSLDELDRRRVLAAAQHHRFSRREVLFHEGEPGDSLHLIGDGRVAVRVGTARGDIATLAVFGPGDIVGELAVASDKTTRSATVVALETTETLTLRRGPLGELRRAHPSVD